MSVTNRYSTIVEIRVGLRPVAVPPSLVVFRSTLDPERASVEFDAARTSVSDGRFTPEVVGDGTIAASSTHFTDGFRIRLP